MPYKDKILAKEYRKRTQVPYMRKWRDKNRERLRKYMREWAKKRRADKNKRQKDKESPGFKMQQQLNIAKWRGRVISLDNIYIKGLLIRRNSISKEAITPEIILIHKKQLLIKRKIKQNDNISNK